MDSVFENKLECAYCGLPAETTDEVIARCFFATPPDEYIKVSACYKCNNLKSVFDSHLRTLVVADDRCFNNPEAAGLFNRVSARFSKLPRNCREKVLGGESIPKITGSGLYVGDVLTSRGYPEFEEGVRWIVRGIFYNTWNRQFPKGYIIRSTNDPEKVCGFWESAVRSKVPSTGPLRLGEGVFSWECFCIPNKPEVAMWFMCFYSSMYVCTLTGVDNLNDNTTKSNRGLIISPGAF